MEVKIALWTRINNLQPLLNLHDVFNSLRDALDNCATLPGHILSGEISSFCVKTFEVSCFAENRRSRFFFNFDLVKKKKSVTCHPTFWVSVRIVVETIAQRFFLSWPDSVAEWLKASVQPSFQVCRSCFVVCILKAFAGRFLLCRNSKIPGLER